MGGKMFKKIFKRKLKPQGADDYVRIQDIIVPPAFSRSTPSKKKIEEYTKRYIKLGYLDIPITVIPETNECGTPNKLVITDGYIRYLIAKDWGMDLVPVKYKREYI